MYLGADAVPHAILCEMSTPSPWSRSGSSELLVAGNGLASNYPLINLGVLVDNNEVVGGKTSMGMEENIEGLLCYILAAFTGVIFLVAEKNSMFVKFHAWQSILLTVAYIAASIVLMILALIVPFIAFLGVILWLAGLVLTVLCMYQAYQGKTFKLPLIGDIAYKQAYGG